MNTGLTVEEMHNYLSMSWYGYGCSDKDKVTEIILEEFSKEHRDLDHMKWKIKRRCQAEA